MKLFNRVQESNTYGVGAKVEVYLSNTGSNRKLHRWMYPITGFACQNDYELHFGLGDFETIDSLDISWPSGLNDTHKDVGVNKHYKVVEDGKIEVVN